MRIRVLGEWLRVVSLVTVACGGGDRTPLSLPSPDASATSVAPRPNNTQPAVQPAEESERYAFEQVSDLSALNSYRVHYTFNWESTRDSQKEAGFWDIWGQFVRQPPARRLAWTGTGTGGAKQELVQVGKDIYMNTGSDWVAMMSSQMDIFMDNPLLVSPLHLMLGTQGKVVRKNVIINRISANHYVLDESTLKTAPGLGVISKAKADVWVSPEFNVVVRYVAHYNAQDLAIGGGEEGTLDLTFDLMDINQPIAITAPEGVKPAVPEDIPILEDVADMSAFSGMITYSSTKSVEEVVAFYDAQMPAQGWSKGEAVMPDRVDFTKGSRTAQIKIQAEEGKTTVAIVSGE